MKPRRPAGGILHVEADPLPGGAAGQAAIGAVADRRRRPPAHQAARDPGRRAAAAGRVEQVGHQLQLLASQRDREARLDPAWQACATAQASRSGDPNSEFGYRPRLSAQRDALLTGEPRRVANGKPVPRVCVNMPFVLRVPDTRLLTVGRTGLDRQRRMNPSAISRRPCGRGGKLGIGDSREAGTSSGRA